MVVIRAFDQRGGQPAAAGPARAVAARATARRRAQVGSAHAARPQDHIFPSYREHVVGCIRGVDPVGIIGAAARRHPRRLGPDRPRERQLPPLHARARIADACTPRATRWASRSTARCGTGDPDRDEAVIVYFGDGATSQGDVSEAFVFAASYQTPAGLLPAEQPLGDLGAGGDAVAHAALPARERLRHPGHPDRRQRRARELRRHGEAPRRGPRRRRPARSSRRSPTGWARTPRATTRPSTAPTRNCRRGSPAIRSRAYRRAVPHQSGRGRSTRAPVFFDSYSVGSCPPV